MMQLFSTLVIHKYLKILPKYENITFLLDSIEIKGIEQKKHQ